jgi:preprotein translocase subunit YajC
LTFAFVFAFAGIPGLALPPGITSLLPFVLIPVVFYFLLMRPNQKKQQTWSAMLAGLKPGDRVTTTGGIRGTIIALRDDALHIRVLPDGVKLEVVKSAIASVTTEDGEK